MCLLQSRGARAVLYLPLLLMNRLNKTEADMSHDMTKQTKCVCAQQRLISESSLSAWRKLRPVATHWAHSEDADQTGRMPRLIWVFVGRTLILLVLSCRGISLLPNPILFPQNLSIILVIRVFHLIADILMRVKKGRRHYLKIHCVLNNVTIFAKLCNCDIESTILKIYSV